MLKWVLIYSGLLQVVSAIVPTFNMHYLCDKTIGYSDEWIGGFLVFDSDLLPSGYQYECTVYLHPKTVTARSHTQGVVFRFLDWYMGGACQDTNLTISEGEKQNEMPHLMESVEGLKNPICGDNSMDDVVYASEDYLTIVFKRKGTFSSIYRAKFNMTFVSYFDETYDGECEEYGNTFTCDNKRCIDKKFVCLNLNPCGDNSDCKITLEHVKTFWENLLDSLKNLVIIIVILVALSVVWKFFKAWHEKHGSLEDIPLIGCLLSSVRSHNSGVQERRSSIASRVSETPVGLGSVELQVDRRSLTSSSDDESTPESPRSRASSFTMNRDGAGITAPPAYEDLPPSAPPVAPELPLPPSYDDVIANSDKYVKGS